MNKELLRHHVEQLDCSQDEDRDILLQELVDLTKSDGQDPTELLMRLGQLALETGKLSLGHRLGDEVIARCQKEGDPLILADAYLLKAYLHFAERQGIPALDYFYKSLQIMIAQGKRSAIARIFQWAGDTCARASGRLLAALLMKRAARLFLEIGDIGSASNAYLDMGRVFLNAGYFQMAIEQCSRAEQLALQSKRDDLQDQVQRLAEKAAERLERFSQEFPIDRLQGLLTSEEGVFYKNPLVSDDTRLLRLRIEATFPVLESSEYDQLEHTYLEQAYRLFASVEDVEGMAFCLFHQGNYWSSLAMYSTALQFYREGLDALVRHGSHPIAEAAIYEKMGVYYLNMGNYRDAIEYNLRAAELDHHVPDIEGEAMCYLNIGTSLHRLGALHPAIESYERALALSELQKAKIHTNLGNVYLTLCDYTKAHHYYIKALKEFESRINPFGMARSYGNLALLAATQGDFEEALQYNQRALDWAEDGGGDSMIQGLCHLNFGHFYYSHDELAKALSHAQAAEEMGAQLGHWDLQRKALMRQARIYEKQNELQAAYSTTERAFDLAQVFGDTLEEEPFKLNFANQVAEDYQFMVELCLRLDKAEEAYHYVEKSKSQSLIALLSATEIRPIAAIDTRMRELLAEEEACLAKLRQVQIGRTTGHILALAPGELEAIRARLQAVYSDLATYDPEYVFLRRREALSYAQIKQLLADKRSSSNSPTPIALIEYFVGTENIYIFVIDAEGHLHIEKAPHGDQRFNLLLENYTREVLHYKPDDFAMNTWQELGVYLLDPVAKYLQAGDHLYMVPHSVLHFLPLHALKVNGDILIRQHTVSYTPSASALKFLLHKGSDHLDNCIAFGVGLDDDDERDLPLLPPDQQARKHSMRTMFEREAREISDLFSGQCLTGAQVTQKDVRQGCVGQDLIYFSCHGHLDNQDPLESGLKLYDGMLTTRQIFNLKLNAELVVLSACETGLNWRHTGDDLIGLTRAFLYAGAASLLVSLWPVESTSTREFMVDFLQQLRKGSDKATALQQAQLHQIEKYPDPFYWAPFILVGDWKVGRNTGSPGQSE